MQLPTLETLPLALVTANNRGAEMGRKGSQDCTWIRAM